VIWNDLLAPFRRGAWDERRGLRANRAIVASIGVFLLFYGLWYPLKGDLWTYLGVTGTIYLASMSVLLVACCYFPRTNSWGAGATIAVGALVPAAYLVLEQLPATSRFARETVGPYWSGLAAYAGAAAAMAAGSFLKNRVRKEGRA
jgi:SSS family solute:Na+ symporter